VTGRAYGALVGIALFGLATAPVRAGAAGLSVWSGDAWRPWWSAAAAVARWDGPDTVLARALEWRASADGIEWATARIACDAPVWRVRLIAARVDPRRVHLSLALGLGRDAKPAWTIDRAPGDALFAVNAGQFVVAMPWGLVVTEGRQRLPAASGPLSTAMLVDTAGVVHWTHGGAPRAPLAGIATAFQSYPTLLARDGTVPGPLRAAGRGVDLRHRDIRLAIGETRDARLLIVMTRFDALGAPAATAPTGLTTPEMAAVMGALGARDAVMLDGGISAQMMLRDANSGVRHRWTGWRKVPLALIARAR
jgi:hypothetical protein